VGVGPKVKKKRIETFAMHLFKIFKPNPREIILEEENKLLFDDTTSVTLDISIKLFTIKEVIAVIKNKKRYRVMIGYLIINQIPQILSEMGIKYIIQFCNAVLRQDFFLP